MKKTESDAINRLRRDNPTEQDDFKRVWQEVEKRRPQVEHFIRVHRWLALWRRTWKRRVADFYRKTPGSSPWHNAALACHDHLRNLFELRREEVAHPDNPLKMKIKEMVEHNPKKVQRAVKILVLLHLRGSNREEKPGAHYLNLALGTDLSFSEPPWSQSALKELSKKMSLGKDRPLELRGKKALEDLLPDLWAQIQMPDSAEAMTVLSDIYIPEIMRVISTVCVMGTSRGRPDPDFDLPAHRIRIAAELLASLDDDSIERIRKGKGAEPAIPYLRFAAEAAFRIGQSLDKNFGGPLPPFPPDPFGSIMLGQRQRVPPPTRTPPCNKK